MEVMYHGQRAGIYNNKVYQLFKTRDGKEYWFSRVKGLWFGDVVQMIKDRIEIRPETVKTTWEPSEKERLEYETNKVLVTAARQERLKEMKLRKPHKNILSAVFLIAPFYRSMSDLDRRRFMKWFANECSKKGKK